MKLYKSFRFKEIVNQFTLVGACIVMNTAQASKIGCNVFLSLLKAQRFLLFYNDRPNLDFVQPLFIIGSYLYIQVPSTVSRSNILDLSHILHFLEK